MGILEGFFDDQAGADADDSDHVYEQGAMVPASMGDGASTSWDHSHDGHAGLVLPPGVSCLDSQLALPDPLVGLGGFGFPCHTLGTEDGVLVDTNGDGVMDHTSWGTPVVRVDDYVRDDGTWVRGHYRTVPDDVAWNNLSERR